MKYYPNLIIIHLDYSLGNEKSYREVLDHIDSNLNTQICTHCLDFFTPDYNSVIMKLNGHTLRIKQLLENDGKYTDKQLTTTHNFPKMLKAGAFNF